MRESIRDWMNDGAKSPQHTLERVTLEKIKFSRQLVLSQAMIEQMSVQTMSDFLSSNIVMQVNGFIYGLENKREVESSIKVPRTWWDAAKLTLRNWLIKNVPSGRRLWWKIGYCTDTVETVVKHWRVCPHLNIATQSNHLEFLAHR